MRRVYGSVLPLLYIPFIGGTLGKLPGLSIPRKYWDTLPWIADIYEYGAQSHGMVTMLQLNIKDFRYVRMLAMKACLPYSSKLMKLMSTA